MPKHVTISGSGAFIDVPTARTQGVCHENTQQGLQDSRKEQSSQGETWEGFLYAQASDSKRKGQIMSIDRIFYWTEERKPTFEQVVMIAEDFVGNPAYKIDNEKQKVILAVPGTASFPFRRIRPDFAQTFPSEQRWLEIFYYDDHYDVVTRMQDEFTGVVADGLAKAIRRYFAAIPESEVDLEESDAVDGEGQ